MRFYGTSSAQTTTATMATTETHSRIVTFQTTIDEWRHSISIDIMLRRGQRKDLIKGKLGSRLSAQSHHRRRGGRCRGPQRFNALRIARFMGQHGTDTDGHLDGTAAIVMGFYRTSIIIIAAIFKNGNVFFSGDGGGCHGDKGRRYKSAKNITTVARKRESQKLLVKRTFQSQRTLDCSQSGGTGCEQSIHFTQRMIYVDATCKG